QEPCMKVCTATQSSITSKITVTKQTGVVMCPCETNNIEILTLEDKPFPNLVQTINKIKTYVMNNPNLLSIFNQLSGYNTEQTLALLEPTNIINKIRITNGITEFGEFNHTTPNVIYIDKYLISQLELGEYNDTLGNKENLNGTSFFVAMTILHELVHYGRFHNSLPQKHNGDEAG
ncbi:hypothetical protein B6A10_16340, partial [Flavobacterium sp. L1I52]|nr:hypothetical protein [Flavobacterium pokkalii]